MLSLAFYSQRSKSNNGCQTSKFKGYEEAIRILLVKQSPHHILAHFLPPQSSASQHDSPRKLHVVSSKHSTPYPSPDDSTSLYVNKAQTSQSVICVLDSCSQDSSRSEDVAVPLHSWKIGLLQRLVLHPFSWHIVP